MIGYNLSTSNTEVLDTSAGPYTLYNTAGHSLFDTHKSNNYIGARFYSDATGLTEVAIGGGSVSLVIDGRAGGLTVNTDGALGQRWSFTGEPLSGTVTFNTVTAAYCRIITAQNRA